MLFHLHLGLGDCLLKGRFSEGSYQSHATKRTQGMIMVKWGLIAHSRC
jgi:hypothetical protein